jgi:hypothetical protein
VADYLSMRIKQLEGPPVLTDDAIKFVNSEIQTPLDEPLSHELLREAWTNHQTNLRSAIVLAVAAAEVGFKQFVSKVFPDTAWILENLQSPPLLRMLELFPWDAIKLQLNGHAIRIPDLIKDGLKKAITLRNEIVHGGKGGLTADTAESVFYCVRDFLYFLDALTDLKWWAMDFVNPEALREFAKS